MIQSLTYQIEFSEAYPIRVYLCSFVFICVKKLILHNQSFPFNFWTKIHDQSQFKP